jgi:hypothetical protein
MATSTEHHGSTSDPGTNQPIADRSPAAESVMGCSPDTTRQHVPYVHHVCATQPEWQAPDFSGRRVWKRRFRDWVYNNDQLLLALVRAETSRTSGDLDLDAITPRPTSL